MENLTIKDLKRVEFNNELIAFYVIYDNELYLKPIITKDYPIINNSNDRDLICRVNKIEKTKFFSCIELNLNHL